MKARLLLAAASVAACSFAIGFAAPALADSVLTLPSVANGQVETTSGPSGEGPPFTSSYGGSVILGASSSGANPLTGDIVGFGPLDTANANVSVSPAIDNGYLFGSTFISAPTQSVLPPSGFGQPYPTFDYQAGASGGVDGVLEYKLVVMGSTPTVAVQIKANASLFGSPTLANASANLSATFTIANVLSDSVSLHYDPSGGPASTFTGAGYASVNPVDAYGLPEYSALGGIDEDGIYLLNINQPYNVFESISLSDSVTTFTSENALGDASVVPGGAMTDTVSLYPSFTIVASDPSQYAIVLSPGVSDGAVPEPSTWAMLLLGFAGLSYAGYRLAKRASLAPDFGP